MDEKSRREEMEASEDTAMSRWGGGDFALHRVDPDRVSRLLAGDGAAAGYARLSLMVGTIFDRLATEGAGRSVPRRARDPR
jgi:hypothetical protein